MEGLEINFECGSFFDEPLLGLAYPLQGRGERGKPNRDSGVLCVFDNAKPVFMNANQTKYFWLCCFQFVAHIPSTELKINTIDTINPIC